ncbi:hypothetical protein RJT34_11081 [Clitoria ternatea]|uniref:PPC domain-containing protein n=1 Tax=Clitoria ternatea TaxID=43366 RepID=A0AAN9JLE5_CLITE
MANNVCASSSSPPSENDTSSQSLTSFTNLSNSSFGMSDVSKDKKPFACNTNGKLPLSLPFQPPCGILSHVPISEVQPQTTVVASAKKPRGRPRGSRNKPKQPTVIMEDADFYKPMMLEIPPGVDVVQAIIDVAHRQQVSIIVHNASGTINEATLGHNFQSPPTISLRGDLNIVYFNGTYISNSLMPPSSSEPNYCSFGIQFSCNNSGQQSRIYGGIVGGKVIASSKVMVMTSIFKKHYSLKVEANDEGKKNNNSDIAAHGTPNTSNNNASMFNLSTFGVVAATASGATATSPSSNVNLLSWNNTTHHHDNY